LLGSGTVATLLVACGSDSGESGTDASDASTDSSLDGAPHPGSGGDSRDATAGDTSDGAADEEDSAIDAESDVVSDAARESGSGGTLDAGADAAVDSGPDAAGDSGPATVSWLSPSANQLFVAAGQTQIAGALPSTSSSTTELGIAAPELSVLAPAGGTLVVSIDQANTPTVESTTVATCSVAPGSEPQTLYVTSSTTCSATAGGAHLSLPVDYGQLLAHTLSATLTPSGGGLSTLATLSVRIDVAEPAAVSPAIALKRAVGVATVTIPTLPGDDESVGGAPAAWDVRYSTEPLTATSWSQGTRVGTNLAGAFPTGVPAVFQVVLPAGNASLYLGVRAVDRVGNLGDLAAASVLSVDTQPLGSELAVVDDSGSAPTSNEDEQLRVADLDGDGYDDAVLDYPSAHGGDGRVLVYFGGSGALANPSTPLVLKGTLPQGFLGLGAAFDVGDFDGDGKDDIASGEAYFGSGGDDRSVADVLIWSGAKMAAWKMAGGSPPSPVVALSDPAALVGGTVRAVGQVTGGTGMGDDLAVTNYVPGDGSVGPFEVAVLPRKGGWLTGTGATTLFSAGSAAAAFITLPADVGGDPNAGTDGATLESATFTYAGGGGDQVGLALSLVDPVTPLGPPQSEHEAMVFAESLIEAGGTLPWHSGTPLPTPADVDAHSRFGLHVSGGKDVIGDAHEDLLLANPDDGKLYLYDGVQLLGVNALATPSVTVYDASSESLHAVGSGASLLGDIDGDGKAEVAGASLASAGAQPVYLWFGQTGDAVTPPLPFFPTANCAATPTTFCFTPARGQRISAIPVFSGSPLGQAVLTGHFTAKDSRDLVVLSQGSAAGELLLLR
jgi:hypothetical protein